MGAASDLLRRSFRQTTVLVNAGQAEQGKRPAATEQGRIEALSG